MIKILKSETIHNSYGTKRKFMEWEGEWKDDEELAEALVDEINAPYGYHIKIRSKDNENKRYTGIISEYWD